MAEQKSTGMATTALVMGIVSIVLSFIPVINFLVWITATLGIVFGIIGMIKKQGSKALVGLILSAVSYFTYFIIFAVLLASF